MCMCWGWERERRGELSARNKCGRFLKNAYWAVTLLSTLTFYLPLSSIPNLSLSRPINSISSVHVASISIVCVCGCHPSLGKPIISNCYLLTMCSVPHFGHYTFPIILASTLGMCVPTTPGNLSTQMWNDCGRRTVSHPQCPPHPGIRHFTWKTGPCDAEIILDCPSGPSVIRSVFKSWQPSLAMVRREMWPQKNCQRDAPAAC